jgi:hypothetical protein
MMQDSFMPDRNEKGPVVNGALLFYTNGNDNADPLRVRMPPPVVFIDCHPYKYPVFE